MNNANMNNTPNNMNTGGMTPMPAKKSGSALNIIIIILVLALIAVIVVSRNKANDVEATPTDDTTTETTGATNGGGTTVPEPVGPWTTGAIKNDITFDVPPNYYVSYPVIGECDNVVSISTQTASDPTVPIALIYKAGCVIDANVTTNFTHQEIKNGYVFQTNATNDSVLSLFNRIVASAK